MLINFILRCIKNAMETKTVIIAFRAEQSLKILLEKIGEKERRSMSQIATFFVEKGIKEYVKMHPELLTLLPESLSD